MSSLAAIVSKGMPISIINLIASFSLALASSFCFLSSSFCFLSSSSLAFASSNKGVSSSTPLANPFSYPSLSDVSKVFCKSL